jgi:NADH-quinone oxidoreductase subunit F
MGNTICAFGEGTAMPALGFVKKFRKDFEAYVTGAKKHSDATLVVESADGGATQSAKVE